MDQFDASELVGVTFDDDLESFLGLPASRSTNFASLATNNEASSHQNFGQSGIRNSQCTGCAQYKADLDRLDKEHRCNFMFLKKKVISTDSLIRRFKAKQEECDQRDLEIQDLKKKLDQVTIDSTILSQQLKAAMDNVKPLHEEKEQLQAELKSKSREVGVLQDRIEAEMALQCQRTAQDERNRNLEMEVTKLKRHNVTLTTKTRSLESRVKELLCEKKGLGISKSVAEKRLENFAVALKEAEDVCNSYWAKLMSHGLTEGEKGPSLIPNGYKSLVRKFVNKCNTIKTGLTNGTGNRLKSDNDSSGHSSSDDDIDFDNLDFISDDDLEDGDSVTKTKTTSQNLHSSTRQTESETETTDAVSDFNQMSTEKISAISSRSKTETVLQNVLGSAKRQEDIESRISGSVKVSASSDDSQKTLYETSKKCTTETILQNGNPTKQGENKTDMAQTALIIPENNKSSKSPAKLMQVSQSKKSTYGLHKHGETDRVRQQRSPNDLINVKSSTKQIETNTNRVDKSVKKMNINQIRHADVKKANATQKFQQKKTYSSPVISDESSLSDLSSSSDESIDDDDDVSTDTGKKDNQGKLQSVDLDTIFSFAYIQDMLSPLAKSPNSVRSVISPVDDLEKTIETSGCPVSLGTVSYTEDSTHQSKGNSEINVTVTTRKT